MAFLDDERIRVAALRDRLEQGILREIGHCRVNGDPGNRLPNTTNLAFDYLDGEAILLHMNRAGIAASSGSACTSGSTEPSHVLKAMAVPVSCLHGAIRLTLSRENTFEEIDRVLAILPGIFEKLRTVSPLWQDRNSAAYA